MGIDFSETTSDPLNLTCPGVAHTPASLRDISRIQGEMRHGRFGLLLADASILWR